MAADHTKPSEREFLARNPFPGPLTTGLFYREKMRAIYRIAPNGIEGRVLEVGGGESGLSTMLFPKATVINLDRDPRYAASTCNQQGSVRFLAADATCLPFPDGSFDVVTMFDVLEHIEEDSLAAVEALRVLRPGGWLLLTTPNDRWRFPFYDVLRPICPSDEDVMREWGHVRRGYSLEQLERVVGRPPVVHRDFINAMTVVGHDVSFSRLPWRLRRLACVMLTPLTWVGYGLQRSSTPGTETAAAWVKA